MEIIDLIRSSHLRYCYLYCFARHWEVIRDPRGQIYSHVIESKVILQNMYLFTTQYKFIIHVFRILCSTAGTNISPNKAAIWSSIYLLTPWGRVILEKLTGFAVSQEIPRIFGTRKFITVLTSAHHLSLSWANSIQSSQPSPTSWRSILILSPHLRLGLPSGLFP